jgi:ABC-2 type transport system ATP-binding protein
MIQSKNLSKRFGKSLAVNDVSFSVETGKVTGFLGPNGAGKSTTMRLMLGLDKGSGATTYNGKALSEYSKPSSIVGILLEAKAFHPTRSARNHLKILAAAGGIADSRVDEVLEIVGLKEVAKKKPGKFSLGMSQRLGIAAALLGKPKYLILDEPANGLDPEGIAWMREFLKDYAANGNAVFVSSHLLSEISQIADNVVVIGKGRLISSTTVDDLISNASGSHVFVRADNSKKLEEVLKKLGKPYQAEAKGFAVRQSKTDELGKALFAAKLTVLELAEKEATLEEAFLEITSDSEEYRASSGRKQK